MDKFYTSHGEFTFENNDGVMSIELNYCDSDDSHCATYREGTDIFTLLNDVIDDIEDQLAEEDDNKADLEEILDIEKEIGELNDRLKELKARVHDSSCKQKNLNKSCNGDFYFDLGNLTKEDNEWRRFFC